MRSSSGAHNPELRTPLWLGGVAFGALLVALLLAFVAVLPHPKPQIAAPTPVTVTTPAPQTPAISAPAAASGSQSGPSSLWPVLLPWGLGVDAAALIGLAAVLIVRARR